MPRIRMNMLRVVSLVVVVLLGQVYMVQAGDAVWSGTASWVWDNGELNWTVDGTPNSAFTDGDTVTINDSGTRGSSSTPIISVGTVSPSSVIISNSAGNNYVDAVIGGSCTVTVAMASNRILFLMAKNNSSAYGTNTYTGGTVVESGRLQVYFDPSLGDSNAPVILKGGEFSLGNKQWASTRPIIVDSGDSLIRSAGNGRWWCNGPVSGTGNVRMYSIPNGGNFIYLWNLTNTFTGDLGIDGSSQDLHVELNSIGDDPGAGTIYWTPVSGYWSHLIWTDSTTNGLVLNNRQLELRGDGDMTDTGGKGAWLKNSSSTYPTIINTDLLVTGSGSKIFQFNAVNSALTNVFAGSINDGTNGASVAFRKDGSGAVILSGSNTHSGGTFLDDGTLICTSTNALGSGDITISSGELMIETNISVAGVLTLPSASSANVTLNGDLTVGALAVAGVSKPVGVYSGEAWIDGSGILTVGAPAIQPLWWDSNGSTSGAGSTPGTWGTDAFWSTSSDGDVGTGAWIDGRTAAFAAGTDASGSYTVGVNGTLNVGGVTFEEGNVTVSGGTALQLAESSSSLFAASGASGTVATVISEEAAERSIIKDGQGVITLSGANTISGPTTVIQGTLVLNNGSAIPPETVDLVGGSLQVDANVAVSNLVFSEEDGSVSGSGTLIFGAGAVINSDWRFPSTAGAGGALHAISCGISGSPDVHLRQSVWYGTDVKCKQNRFEPSGDLTQTLGVIRFDYYNDSGSGNLVVFGGSSTNNTVETFSSPNHCYEDVIRKEGSGTWTITGDSAGPGAYGYDVQVREGTLIWNGSLAQGSQYSITNGRFAGNHSYASTYDARGNVNIMSSGIISPGVGGPGTMIFDWTGNTRVEAVFRMHDSSIYEYDVGATTNDIIHISGTDGGGNTETLHLDNFILRVLDAGGEPKGEPLPVFTYDSYVTVDTNDFPNTAQNFDLATAGIESWGSGGLSLSNNVSEGIIYLVGLVKPPEGTVILLR
jgi:autotransporter-associated beta strand protein